MDIGHFYYLNDQYFIDFPDPKLMQNKETINGQVHDRPCFYTFQDTNTGIYWMIEYSCAVTPQIRQAGNRLSGLAEPLMRVYSRNVLSNP